MEAFFYEDVGNPNFLSRLYGVEAKILCTLSAWLFLSRLYGVEESLTANKEHKNFLSRLYGVEGS